MNKMNNELKDLIIKNTIRDIQIKMLKAEIAGMIISREVMDEILSEVENGSPAEKTDSVPLTLREAKSKGYRVFSYGHGDYSYKTNGIEHLIRNGKEVAKGGSVFLYENGDYFCVTNGRTHRFNKDGVEITE